MKSKKTRSINRLDKNGETILVSDGIDIENLDLENLTVSQEEERGKKRRTVKKFEKKQETSIPFNLECEYANKTWWQHGESRRERKKFKGNVTGLSCEYGNRINDEVLQLIKTEMNLHDALEFYHIITDVSSFHVVDLQVSDTKFEREPDNMLLFLLIKFEINEIHENSAHCVFKIQSRMKNT